MIVATKVENADYKETLHQVDVRTLCDKEYSQILHFTLQPGESLKKHTAQIDVLFYVLEGTGVIEVGEEKMVVSADTLIESPTGTMRRWSNKSENPLRVLVIRLLSSKDNQ